jgi:uncharacterized caspase-like protein
MFFPNSALANRCQRDLGNPRRSCASRVRRVVDMPLAISLLVLVIAAASGCGTNAPARAGAAAEPPRYALVIGQARYAEFSVLPNVPKDLKDMCAALGRLRFKVTCRGDLPTRTAFMAEVESFAAKVPPGSSVLLYYAGHAIQMGGENYLIPTQVSAGDSQGWLQQFVRLSELFAVSDGARASFQIIVLDACRDDPESAPRAPAPGTAVAQTTRRSAGQATLREVLTDARGGGKSASYGVSVRDAPRNTLVLYATGAGTSAFDGDSESNGPLTRHLLLQMQRPQLTIYEAINNVIRDVGNDTERRYQKRQEPLIYGSFREFCFESCPQMVNMNEIEDQRRKAQQRLLQNAVVPSM